MSELGRALLCGTNASSGELSTFEQEHETRYRGSHCMFIFSNASRAPAGYVGQVAPGKQGSAIKLEVADDSSMNHHPLHTTLHLSYHIDIPDTRLTGSNPLLDKYQAPPSHSKFTNENYRPCPSPNKCEQWSRMTPYVHAAI